MSRKITIYKYQGNTDYSVYVEDSYGTIHDLGFYLHNEIDESVEKDAEEIWNNEVKPKKDLLGDAIAECVQIDKDRGIEPSLD